MVYLCAKAELKQLTMNVWRTRAVDQTLARRVAEQLMTPCDRHLE
jgi:hypothetical protein